MIKLETVIEELEFINDGFGDDSFYDPLKEEIVYASESDRGNDDLDDWLENCIPLPSKFDIDEYNMMEEFIATIDDSDVYNDLYNAIRGRGAFRYFKDTCREYNILDDWYQFRDNAYKGLAIEWCEDNNIEYEE